MSRFWLETFGWLPAIFMSAWLTFRKQPSITHPAILKLLPIFAPFLLVIIRLHQHSDATQGYFSNTELINELDLYQGRCGFIVLAIGVLTSVIGFSLVRRWIFSNEIEVGASALVSSGCFASFLMQFVCTHESTLHLFIWHFTPLMLLGVCALYLEKRFCASPRPARPRPSHQVAIQGQYLL